MPTLVRCDGNGLNVFLYGTIDNFPDLPVVPEMDHLNTCTLQYAAHNINGSIVPVEECSGGNYADMVFRFIDFGLHGGIGMIRTNIEFFICLIPNANKFVVYYFKSTFKTSFKLLFHMKFNRVTWRTFELS